MTQATDAITPSDVHLGEALRDGLSATWLPLELARTLPREVYTSPEIFALEQRMLFGRTWLAVCREEDLPETGSFVTHAIGRERVLILRGENGVLRAFFNVCRHRGSRLVEEPCGQLRGAVTCPYHGWSYGFDGRLLAATRSPADFDPNEYPLVQAPLGTREGFVFVSLDPNAIELEHHLGELPDLDRYEIGALRRGRRLEYEVAANWKTICENYSECYHCPLVHPQLHRISDVIGDAMGDAAGASPSGYFESAGSFNGGPMRLRDGVETMSTTGRSGLAPLPGLSGNDLRLVRYYLVYPNLMLGLHPDYVMVHQGWPLAVDRTRVTCDFLFRPEALARPGFDPSAIVEFWDVTNRQDWGLCERVQAGAASAGYAPGPYHPSERCVHAFDRWYAGWVVGEG
jgi:Rieske 2Fe-2S family protein